MTEAICRSTRMHNNPLRVAAISIISDGVMGTFGENILDKSHLGYLLSSIHLVIHRHGSIFRTMG